MNTFESTPLLSLLPETMTLSNVRTGHTLSHATLMRAVDEMAAELTDRIGSSGARVVIGIADPVRCLTTLFAVWVSGNCAVMVNPGLKPDERSRVAAKVGATLWCDDAELRDLADGGDPPKWQDAALILMTSGTTGDPKGITHSLESLTNRLRLNVAEIGAGTLAQTLCPLPLFFGHGLIGNGLTALFAGQSLHVLDRPGVADFARFGSMIDTLGVTFFSSVPSMWRMILRTSQPPEKRPRRVHVGSAPLPNALWSEIEAWVGSDAVFNAYGMTETANWISGGRRPTDGREGHVGQLWGGDVRVRRDGASFATGRGEVAVRTPAMMLGLWGMDVATPIQDGYLMTGDIGELDADGTLWLVGRTKNEINRAGIKVLAEEVDMLLERHPAVVEACAFAIPDEVSGELVAAVVRVIGDGGVQASDIIDWCRGEVRAEAVPHRLAIVDDIPKNDRGKIARTDVQRKMVETWS